VTYVRELHGMSTFGETTAEALDNTAGSNSTSIVTALVAVGGRAIVSLQDSAQPAPPNPPPPPAKLITSDFFRHPGVFSHGAGALIFRAVEDADLIRKACRGDVEAYNLLISRWERRVYNYLLRIVANREDALDLSQDVFLKAYQNLRKLDDPARFAPWLYRIAHNEAYSLFRKRRPEGETEELQPETLEGAATLGGNAVFPVELTLAVSSALRKLTADQRETVILKIYQGFKFEEIAEIVAAPVSTVKSRLYTALDLLKTELSPVKTPTKARGVS
jgi:RNA polymerase sigma-70 factor, ECF subfamily